MVEKVEKAFTIINKLSLRGVILLFSLTLVFNACEEEDGQGLIPEVLVDFTLRLDLPEFDDLRLDGGWVYIEHANGNTAGYRGIILYRQMANTYIALDRACSYKPLESCHLIKVEDSNSFLECECGDSKFNFDGTLINPPASRPLKRYNTLYSPSDNSLRIVNSF